MSNKHTWLFIISCLFLSMVTVAQENEETTEEISEETAEKTTEENFEEKPIKESVTLALRAGIDLYKPIRTQFDKEFQGLEFVGDLKVGKRLYIASEIGTEKRTIEYENLNFTTSGSYIKLGIDYNMYNNWVGLNNDIFLGLRFGRSIHSQTLNNYLVYINHHYWDTPVTTSGFANGERETLSTGWLEVVFGTKVEVTSRFFLGISLRVHRILSNQQPDNFGNLYVPGFNKVTDGNNFGSSFNYTLTYSLPFRFKKKIKAPEAP
ncbi:MAG: DUF6048 family protein [Flavobacteriaceae bacterium]